MLAASGVVLAGIAANGARAAAAEPSPKVVAASQPDSDLRLNQLSPCTTKYDYSVCVYGVNNTSFFTGPNTLAGGKYQLATTYNQGTGHIDWWWPPVWPGGSQATCPNSGPQWTPDSPWCLQAGDNDNGTLSMAVYNSPTDAAGNTALPPWEQLYVTYEVLSGEHNHGTCGPSPDLETGVSSNYTICPPNTPQFEGGNHPNFVFTIDNQPLTVQIMNNLPTGSDLVLDDAFTASPSLTVDPAGGSPTTIPAGTIGYYGAYQPISVVSALGSPRLGFTYTVSGATAGLPGASFVMNLVLDGKGGIQNEADACSFLPSGANQSASCTVSIAGAQGSPQTITIDITKGGSTPTASTRGESR